MKYHFVNSNRLEKLLLYLFSRAPKQKITGRTNETNQNKLYK